MILIFSNIKNFWQKYFRELLICLFLLLITFAAYAQVKNFNFINLDDDQYVTINTHIQEGITLHSIEWAFTTTYAANWHPVTWLSFMLDYQLFGLNPGGYHLTNLFFHIIDILLLFLIFRQMTGMIWPSAFIAALFGLHPLHVESVAWVSERKDVLSTLFFLLTIWSYARYTKLPSIRRYGILILFFALGLMSKPMLVTLPFVLLLLDIWPLDRLRFRQLDTLPDPQKTFSLVYLVKEKIPLFVLSALSCVITVYAQKQGGAIVPLQGFSFPERIANAMVAYAGYIEKMIYPVNLAVLYPFAESIPLWKVLGAVLLLGSISYLTIKTMKRHPYLLVGWLWYLGTLVPVIGIVQVGNQAMADRYTYIPLIGLFIMIAWGIPNLLSRFRYRKISLTVAALAVISIFSAITVKQISYWKNSITLFSHAISITRDNYFSQYNLAQAYTEKGMDDAAIPHYYKSLELNSNNTKAYINLGLALNKKGQFDKAIALLNTALGIKSKNMGDTADIHINLGLALERKGKLDEAISQYQKALTLDPANFLGHYNLGNALMKKGRFEKAAEQYRRAMEITPGDLRPHRNLGLALLRQNKLAEAAQQFKIVLKSNPRDAGAYNLLGATYMGRHDTDRAIACLRNAIKINPDYAEAKNNLQKILEIRQKIEAEVTKIKKSYADQPENPELYRKIGDVYLSHNDYTNAIHNYKKALSIDPGLMNAQYNLAITLAETGEYDKAIVLFKKIIAERPGSTASYYNIACLYSRQDRKEEAIAWLKRAISHGYDNWKQIKSDPDLHNIRSTPYFLELEKKH